MKLGARLTLTGVFALAFACSGGTKILGDGLGGAGGSAGGNAAAAGSGFAGDGLGGNSDTGGTAPIGGGGGSGIAGSTAGGSGVRVIRGDPDTTEWWDVTIRGADLTQFDGALVTVRVGLPDRPPERLGSGQARIVDGSFEIRLPQVWEPDVYKQKLVYIDVNDSGQCEPGVDSVFNDSRATPMTVLTLPNNIGGSTYPERDCAALNAIWPTE